MATDLINLVETTQYRDDVPEFDTGDTVNVHVRVIEGEKQRIQQYQGVVIAFKGSGVRRTFTVRKVSNGIGVERIFPMHSPRLAKIEVVRRGQVRRAKLYYLRSRKGKVLGVHRLAVEAEEHAADGGALGGDVGQGEVGIAGDIRVELDAVAEGCDDRVVAAVDQEDAAVRDHGLLRCRLRGWLVVVHNGCTSAGADRFCPHTRA